MMKRGNIGDTDFMRDYRSVPQVAHILGITQSRANAMRREGLLHAVATPAGWLVPIEEVARLKQVYAQRRAAKQQPGSGK